MATDLRMLFPASPRDPSRTLRLLLVAEGFTDAHTFHLACGDLITRLVRVTPFNIARYRSWLTVMSLFAPSIDPGPALGGTPGETPLRSTYDKTTHKLALDADALVTLLARYQLPALDGAAPRPASDVFPAPRARGPLGTAIIVLLPAVAGGDAISGELELSPDPTQPTRRRFVATTIDGDFHRVVARELGSALGLEDEWQSDAADKSWPPLGSILQAQLAPNALFLADPPTQPPAPDFKWWRLLTPSQRATPLPVTPHAGPPGTPDVTPPATPFSQPDIHLVEGTMQFRTKLYRGSADCLMRRRVGGPLSPKQDHAPFCTVCQNALAGTLGA